MANPNKTVAAFMAKRSRPVDFETMERKAKASPMMQDMARFQAGEMSSADFMAKWGK